MLSSQIEKIASLIETRTVVVSHEIARQLPRQPGFPPEASFPLLLPNVLPADVDRVLFLDPDLLILDDISTTWNTELGGSVLAAVSDQVIPTCS